MIDRLDVGSVKAMKIARYCMLEGRATGLAYGEDMWH